MNIILASASPRRFELLSEAGFIINVVKPVVEEIVDTNLSPARAAEEIAKSKGLHVIEKTGDLTPVVSADTIVVCENQILGKPSDKNHAREMISLLSGKTHQVITGCAIFYKGKIEIFSVSTNVSFKQLSKDEIEYYISTEEPYDKAGAYAIQGIGSFMISSISGSYSNVVGLPVNEVAQKIGEITSSSNSLTTPIDIG